MIELEDASFNAIQIKLIDALARDFNVKLKAFGMSSFTLIRTPIATNIIAPKKNEERVSGYTLYHWF